MFHMDLYLVFSPCFRTNMYALDLMHMHMHYDHLNVYDVLFLMTHVLISMIFAMFIRLMLYMISC